MIFLLKITDDAPSLYPTKVNEGQRRREGRRGEER